MNIVRLRDVERQVVVVPRLRAGEDVRGLRRLRLEALDGVNVVFPLIRGELSPVWRVSFRLT